VYILAAIEGAAADGAAADGAAADGAAADGAVVAVLLEHAPMMTTTVASAAMLRTIPIRFMN
jgi:hypothetical protein